MGWQDAPLVKPESAGGGWASAPVVAANPRESEIPGHEPPQPQAGPEPGFLDKVRDTINGAPGAATSIATGTGAAAIGNIVGAVRAISSGKFGTQEGIREGEEAGGKVADKLTYQPKSEAAKNTLGRVGDLMKPLEGIPPNLTLGPAGKATAGAARGVGSGAAKVGEVVRDAASPAGEVAELARKAESMGITVRPDMLYDNKFAKMIGEALEKVPASGSKSEQRQIAFNRALMGQIGAEGSETRLTPKVFDAAMSKSGKAIGDIADRTPVPFNDQFSTALQSFVTDAERFETSDVGRIVRNYADDVKRLAKENGGTIPGESFRKLSSKLGAQVRRAQGDTKFVLGELEDVLHDALGANLQGDDAALLAEARRRYAIGKTIEPLIAKSPKGDISPAGLMGVMTADKGKKSMMARGRAGDMGDIARIGQMFLKEPGTSNTTERAVAFGMLGGGAYVEPHTAAGVYGAANAYNRGGPAVSRYLLKSKDAPKDVPVGELLE